MKLNLGEQTWGAGGSQVEGNRVQVLSWEGSNLLIEENEAGETGTTSGF